MQFLQDRPRLLLPKALSCGRIELPVASRPLDPVQLLDDRQGLRARDRCRRQRLLEVPAGGGHASDFYDPGVLYKNVIIGGGPRPPPRNPPKPPPSLPPPPPF